MFTLIFWKQVAERALKTGAQALIAMFAADKVGLLDVDWAKAGSVAAMALILSILTSIVSAPVGPDKGSPSLVDTPPPGPDAQR